MFNRTLKPIILALALGFNSYALAQEPPKPGAKPAPKVLIPSAPPFGTPAPKGKVYQQANEIQAGPVTMKIARGTRIAVSSKSTSVKILGVDGDTLLANATSEAGAEPIQTQVSGEASRPRILLFVPAVRGRRSTGSVNLEIKAPRYTEIESVESVNGNIDVSDMDSPVTIINSSGEVNVNRVGNLKITTRTSDIVAKTIKGDLIARSTHGNVAVDNVTGAVDVAATNGNVEVRNIGGDVRANLATGDIDAHCLKGRADLSSASGSITIIGATGDVEATTASGEVTFKGVIRSNGRYKLKSISGKAEMLIQPDAPGFTATLMTYSGNIETAFPLKVQTPLQGGPINRRISGVYRDGGAQITLDSFSGAVSLAKGSPADWKGCK